MKTNRESLDSAKGAGGEEEGLRRRKGRGGSKESKGDGP